MAEPADFTRELRAGVAPLAGERPYTADLLKRAAEEIDTMRAIWRTHKCSARPGASVGQCIDDYGCNCSCGLFIPRESQS